MSKIVVATSSPLGEEAIGKVALHLSEALAQKGLLKSLVYTHGKPLEKSFNCAIKINPPRIPFIGRFSWGRKALLQYQKSHYQKKTAKIIKSGNGLFYVWILQSRKPLEKCRKLGVKSVVECGFLHPHAFRDIVAAECQKYNIPQPWHISPQRISDSLHELELADIIAVPSQLVADSFIARGFKPDKFLIMPPGVDCDYFRPSAAPGAKNQWALYIGRLELAKGVHHLISAWQRIKRPGHRLVLVGNMQPCLKSWLAANPQMLDDSVELAGIQTDIRPYLEKSLFIVLPSLADGFGMAVMEGMSAGLPAIVTDNCGVKMAIDDGENGWMVPPSSVEILAETIEKAFSNSDTTREMGCRARTEAMNYSWDRFQERAVSMLGDF